MPRTTTSPLATRPTVVPAVKKAALAQPARPPYYLCASLICGDMLNLGQVVRHLEEGGIDYIHFDVMDGLFVPRYGLHPEMLKAVRSISPLPVDVHLMVENPDPYINEFAAAGAEIIAVHAESCRHLHRTLSLIRQAGAKAGVVLNPATSLDVLRYVLDDIDMVMLMAINPGIVGHKLIPGAMEKIRHLRAFLGDRDIRIMVDGGVTFESGPQMLAAGADMYVCGSSTIFKPDQDLRQKIREFRGVMDGITAPV